MEDEDGEEIDQSDDFEDNDLVDYVFVDDDINDDALEYDLLYDDDRWFWR